MEVVKTLIHILGCFILWYLLGQRKPFKTTKDFLYTFFAVLLAIILIKI